jgi:hypothetical protein
MTQRKARARRKGVRRASEKLNAAEEAFCQHYVVHRNASEAYRSAVPSAERKRNQTVAEQASRWRAKRKVRARIAELEKNLAEKAERRFGITTDWVLQRYAAIGGASVEDFVKIDARSALHRHRQGRQRRAPRPRRHRNHAARGPSADGTQRRGRDGRASRRRRQHHHQDQASVARAHGGPAPAGPAPRHVEERQ